ncbi:MAG: HPr family phosphocarrier protein [Firmicutes bacterium]|nr:HPr family phosphocarrier protein [[Eubacterium] siraeum]MCM1489200.1 HPr family phosphocarrier protein [Bacillota bacterium]
MVEYKVKISTINDVKKFVNAVSKYDFDVDLISGRYAIDAKSIMGIFSIDLSKELVLKAHTDNADVVKADLAEYIIG